MHPNKIHPDERLAISQKHTFFRNKRENNTKKGDRERKKRQRAREKERERENVFVHVMHVCNVMEMCEVYLTAG